MTSHAIEAVVQQATHTQRILCPDCSSTRRKHPREKTLSITIDGDTKIYNCFHCGLSGALQISNKPFSPRRDPFEDFMSSPSNYHQQKNVIELPSATHDRELKNFMVESRHISEETYRKFNVVTDIRWFDKKLGEQLAVGFVYGDKADPSAIKWRSLRGKAFTQTGAAQTFYGLEQLPEDLGEQPLIICEGELDALSFTEAGMPAISVPNGAPAKPVRHDDGVKFDYLWQAKEILESVDKIILAVDHDGPGDNLKQEIARRIGRGKCYEVQFSTELKDANAVLCAEGPERLQEIIEACTPMPLAGVFSASDYQAQVEELYDAGGTGSGLSTGFKTLDKLMTIAPGLYIVTGQPGHGKSSWIDALLQNCAEMHGMKFAICSMENPPHIHILKMSALHCGKPFFEGPKFERMSKNELCESTDWINDHFCFLENKDGEVATIDSILDRTKDALLRLGVNGLLIDPYNFLENRNVENEHQSISQILSKTITFAQAHQLTVFFCAHPTKMPFGESQDRPINGNAISGSASWNAKADVGITVFRTNDPNDHTPQISIWKARFPWIAKRGAVSLNYDTATGRFSDIEDSKFDWSVNKQ